MAEYHLARQNGRNIPQEDKIFGISNRAKKMIAEEGADKVINATIGSLLDDDGRLIVLSSVDKVFRELDPQDYADYAPIGGTPAFREAVKKAAFGSYEPKGFTEAVATPGGTGTLRNVIANYSEPGDKIITSDWHWAPYNTIAGEIGRSVATFELFTADRKFNWESFRETVNGLLESQQSLVVIHAGAQSYWIVADARGLGQRGQSTHRSGRDGKSDSAGSGCRIYRFRRRRGRI